MQNLTKRIYFAIVLFILIFIAIPILLLIPKPQGRVYDCGMAEWHPDIPVEVKEECRKLRANKKLTTT